MYYVYILEHWILSDDGLLYYVGHTENSFNRIIAHLWGTGASATFRYGVRRIAYLDICETREEAKDVERVYQAYIKQGWVPHQDCSFISVDGLGRFSFLL